ncbi:carboxymuconolactone decarboxylase family protein [soil metagenome]
MARLKALNPEEVTGKTKVLFDGIKGKLGVVPNLMRTMGNSPSVLEAYLNFSGALSSSKIGGQLAELIALTVAKINNCQYCAAAHSYLASKVAGIDDQTIEKARNLEPIEPKIDAALTFAKLLVVNRGNVSNEELNTLKEAGYSDGEIAEIIAHVALNIFTNYINHVADTEVDFPKVELNERVLNG